MMSKTLEKPFGGVVDSTYKIVLLADPSIPAEKLLTLIHMAPSASLRLLPDDYLLGMSTLSQDLLGLNNQQKKVVSDPSNNLKASPLFGGFAECDLAAFEAETKEIFDHFLSVSDTTEASGTDNTGKPKVQICFNPRLSLADRSTSEFVDLLMTLWNNKARIVLLVPFDKEDTKAGFNIITILESYPDATIVSNFDESSNTGESFDALVQSWIPEEKF